MEICPTEFSRRRGEDEGTPRPRRGERGRGEGATGQAVSAGGRLLGLFDHTQRIRDKESPTAPMAIRWKREIDA
jgi:hypothetical protein